MPFGSFAPRHLRGDLGPARRSAPLTHASTESISGVTAASVSGMPRSRARLSARASSRRIRPAIASLVSGGGAPAPRPPPAARRRSPRRPPPPRRGGVRLDRAARGGHGAAHARRDDVRGQPAYRPAAYVEQAGLPGQGLAVLDHPDDVVAALAQASGGEHVDLARVAVDLGDLPAQ